MTLCDIGNTTAKFYKDGVVRYMENSQFESYEPSERIYFISVNAKFKEKLEKNDLFFDLEPFYELNTEYKGLGIDRVAACTEIKDGVIVDAGTAITLDLMENSRHKGGVIMPGIYTFLNSYSGISPRLNVVLNTQIDLEKLPNRTVDAVSYGLIKSVILLIKDFAKDRKIYFTGGDGHYLSQFFSNSIYDRNLIFRSMLNLLKQKDIK